ncbi:PREDICTED: proline-rich receptor-like protein kinase PERK2 [Atta colombica]|uniref:proline-rich receptor-like protein kinase PERK2 n=1 Tax=Atta colombica TaxID=520822 RepID=UPI00084C2490|nr:PREDICTED: proline-rich receptor-like protein kinase PERK2 [Atta colombica]
MSGQTPEMPPAAPRPSGVIKCTLESPPPMTRLLVVAGLSHRPPGLPGIIPERTSPPLSPMGVTGLTNERQPPIPMPMRAPRADITPNSLDSRTYPREDTTARPGSRRSSDLTPSSHSIPRPPGMARLTSEEPLSTPSPPEMAGINPERPSSPPRPVEVDSIITRPLGIVGFTPRSPRGHSRP